MFELIEPKQRILISNKLKMETYPKWFVFLFREPKTRDLRDLHEEKP